MINVILVDDHPMFLTGIRMYIESACDDVKIVGEAGSGEELFRLPELASADLTLLDIEMPGMSGIEAASRLRCEYPEMKILAFSAITTNEVVDAMLISGINGFISKSKSDPENLVEAIRSVASGHEYFGADIAEIIFNIYINKKKTAKVTDECTAQERQIIELCGQGLSARKIARQLNITHRTVEHHKQNIFEKLGIHSTHELIQYAIKNGIIKIKKEN
jgi:DNA-binding NarL/FixJ family response regulator